MALADGVLMTQEPTPSCDGCGGTGFVIVERDGATRARPCSCRRTTAGTADLGAALRSACVPQRYAEKEFENFACYDPKALDLNKAKRMAERFAEEYPLDDRGLLFMGPPGVGKTHLAVAILRRLMAAKRVECLFSDVQDLLRQLQATFDRQSGMSQLDLLQPVLQTELVVLDDLGGRQFSPWVEETLAHIVTTRYNDRKATLVTTNYLDEPPDPRLPTLSDRIGARVRSRLHEMCHLVVMKAGDFRRDVERADHHGVPDRIVRSGEPV